MADISPARENILTEEADFKSPFSEAYNFKVGGSINFINNRQYDKHTWKLNLAYAQFSGKTGLDGEFAFLEDGEITGFSYFNGNTGTSGTSTMDVHRFDSSGTDLGSIWSTKPAIDSTAANNSATIRNERTGTTLANPTGHTLGVLSVTELDEGDYLRFDLDSAMSGASNISLTIYWRPR